MLLRQIKYFVTVVDCNSFTEAAKVIQANLTIPCTGCGYCTVQCPQHIEITRHLQKKKKKFDGFQGWR